MGCTTRLLSTIEARRPRTWIVPILVAALVAWLPAQAIYFLVAFVVPGPSDANLYRRTFDLLAMSLIIAPVVETYGMRGLFWLLSRFIPHRTMMSWVAAALWGAMHWNTPSWGLHAIWPFYVMGVCYLTLCERDAQLALYVTMLLHACFNAYSCSAHFLSLSI